MKISFLFISDFYGHWSLKSLVRLEELQFIIEDNPSDLIAESLLSNRFPELEDEPVASSYPATADQPFRRVIINGNGFRIDFLDSAQSDKITSELARKKTIVIQDALTSTPDANIGILKTYLGLLQIELMGCEKKYLVEDLFKRASDNWLEGFRCGHDLLDDPDKIPLEKCIAIHTLLTGNIEELNRILIDLEKEYPRQPGDVIEFEQNYAASYDVKRLSINLFKTAAISCIKELTLCADKLTPAYYKKAIQQYETQFMGLLEPIAVRNKEKRAFIQAVYDTLGAHYLKSTELKPLILIFMQFKRLAEILTLIAEHEGLNETNLKELQTIFLLCEPELTKKLIQLYNNITSLSQLELLMPATITPLLASDSVYTDKSCPARTSASGYLFFGSASHNEDSYKRMWSIYCIGIENQLVSMIKEQKTLSELIQFAAAKRQNIALIRKEASDCLVFGRRRKGQSLQDTYADDKSSIISTSLFPVVSTVVCNQYDYSLLLKLTNNDEKPLEEKFCLTNTYKLGIQFDKEQIQLPHQIMQTYLKRTDSGELKPTKIIVQFSPLDHKDFEKMLHFFDQHFLAKCRAHEYTDEEFVGELGILIFYLVRSYPFSRGTGAILQYQARSLVSYYTDGEVNLGDIRLGGNTDTIQSIPYDVYAHLVQSPEIYAQAFKKAVLPAFAARNEAKPIMG